MSGDIVKFLIKGKSFEKSFDRTKIKLGTLLYVKEILNGADIEVCEKEFSGSTKFAVSWISPSSWAVTLDDIYHLEYSQVLSTQKLLDRYMSSTDVLNCISHKASKLRLEHLYKTSEFDKSALRVIFAVTERLNFINTLKEEDVSRKLFHHWEPLVVYHLLTCFDLLGQPHSWKTFDAWLTSSNNLQERKNATDKIDAEYSKVEYAKNLYQEYQNIYGTKNSFFRFIREVLPAANRQELFDSIKIHTNSMPPSTETISEDGTDLDKEHFMYEMRNNYTHKAKVIHGMDFKSIFGQKNEYSLAFTQRIQEFKATKWITYYTANWPEVLEHVVKIGLAEILKKDINDNNGYTKYSFKHKYFRAFKPDGTEKTGVNRILYNLRGEEITREYVPEGFPKEFEWATIEEIDKFNVMYPNMERSELIRPSDK